MGGTGLMALPRDLMVTAQYLMKQISSGTNAFSNYLRAAVSLQVPTLHSGRTIDEQQGYGYQFWRIRNGFAMYGMGGQYVLFYPDPDIILVITADSQNIKGGSQKILDAVYEVIAPYYSGVFSVIAGNTESFSGAADETYRLLPNKGGFTELILDKSFNHGILTLKHPEAIYRISFGWGSKLETAILSKYNQPAASSAKWLDEHSLLIHTQLVGECVGLLSFMLHFHANGLTLWMDKTAESGFHEFCDFAEGIQTRPLTL